SGNQGGWTLLIDGTPQSYVDTEHPTRLEYEYIRWLAAVLDASGPAGSPLRGLHLGGGGLTLPRYVYATRSGSSQPGVEREAALIALIRRTAPLPPRSGIRIRCADAREIVEQSAAGRFDVVIADVFCGARVPGRLTTVEFAGAVSRVLNPDGTYA